jgi:hypothetical protein
MQNPERAYSGPFMFYGQRDHPKENGTSAGTTLFFLNFKFFDFFESLSQVKIGCSYLVVVISYNEEIRT